MSRLSSFCHPQQKHLQFIIIATHSKPPKNQKSKLLYQNSETFTGAPSTSKHFGVPNGVLGPHSTKEMSSRAVSSSVPSSSGYPRSSAGVRTCASRPRVTWRQPRRFTWQTWKTWMVIHHPQQLRFDQEK